MGHAEPLAEEPGHARTGLRHAWRALARLVDFVLPHRCAGCAQIVGAAGGFCPECWARLHFIAGPACARCDLPLEVAAPGAWCGGCIAATPPYSRVHVPLAYGQMTRGLVLRLKYGRRTGSARLMGGLMAGAVPPFEPDRAPLLVPVPLHRWRLWSRGFNQSVELARAIARRRGIDLAVDALRRTRATVPLRGLGKSARARAVRGAFTVPQGARGRIAGRTILLVDDVFTTGATVAAASRALLRAGAARVEVVAFARVLDLPDGDPAWSGVDSPAMPTDIRV